MMPGEKLPVVLTVWRPLDEQEEVTVNGKKQTISNIRGTLFWATLSGNESEQRMLVQASEETSSDITKRHLLVKILETL